MQVSVLLSPDISPPKFGRYVGLINTSGFDSDLTATFLFFCVIGVFVLPLKARMIAPRFYILHLILSTYDYNIHVECLLPANLCFVTLLNSGQCSQFERFRLHHVQMANKTSVSKQN